jgi:hypothetical protein
LTGDQICADLRELCASAQITVDWQTPPGDCDLLAGLNAEQLVDVLVESVHGDGDRELRGQRAADTRILSAVAEALGESVTLARIVDALSVLLRLTSQTPTLTAMERQHIADELFTREYLATVAVPLQRLEAHLHPLRALATTDRPPATLTIMGTVNAGTSARSELLDDLIVAWVTRRVATRPELCRTLVLAGADYLAGRHVERLADICARQGVTLILLWRHLRDTAHQTLGGGAVALMRLRNADEAGRAADFIGRQHRFVLSGLTRTLGGSSTQTDGTGTSEAVATSTSRGFARAGRIDRLIDHSQAWTRSEGSTSGITRSTSTQTATATGTTYSDATSMQRVYEYAVEPAVLQGLPEQALLLVDHGPHGAVVQALDCNPAIVTLPSVNMVPASASVPASVTIPQPRSGGAITYAPPSPAFTTQPAIPPVRQRHSELWSDPDWSAE